MSWSIRFAIKLILWSLTLFSLLLLVLWFTGLLQDGELSQQSIAINKIVEKSTIPLEENRFYYLSGMEAPSSYQPHVWAKVWLDEQNRFYAQPQNTRKDFDFFVEYEDFRDSPLQAQILQDEIESYKDIWGGTNELFSRIDTAGFISELPHCFSEKDEQNFQENLLQGKRNLLLKRYKHGRSRPASAPLIVTNFRAVLLYPPRRLINTQQYLLLDICNRILHVNSAISEQDIALIELQQDAFYLRQWLQNSNGLVEYAVVKRMLVNNMEISLLLLQEMKKEWMRHSDLRREQLQEIITENGNVLLTFLPREAIAREFVIEGIKVQLWHKSQLPLQNYLDISSEMFGEMGDSKLPLMIRVLQGCPEKLYPLLVKVFLKPDYTQNLLAESFQFLLDMDMQDKDSGAVKQKIDDQESAQLASLFNRLYNSLGIWPLSDSGQWYGTSASSVYSLLFAPYLQETVLEIQAKSEAVARSE